MVRVISQNFSPPRSRHSSGETDWDLAERADSALSALGKKRSELGISEYESSSDSFWDSEFDLDHQDDINSKLEFGNDDINGNESTEKSDVHSRRKERRRERNKLSAQAYRKRKRQISNSKQQELFVLEEKNKHLRELVNRLEKKTEKAKMALRGISVSAPDVSESAAVKGSVEGAPFASSFPAAFAREKITIGSTQQHNLNLNENLIHHSQAQEYIPIVGSHHHDSAKAMTTGNPLDHPNANMASLTSIVINANSLVGANHNNASANGFSSYTALRPLVPAKSKPAFYNANINYKSPILRPSTLQTVPEIPLCLQGDLDDNTAASDEFCPLLQANPSSNTNKEEARPCYSMKMAFHKNINLNNSNFDYANDNFRKIDSNACDNRVQMNSFQLVNINGNLNQNVNAGKQEVYP